ncbi:MAG TPA: hypothetical protein VIP05_25000, partial [Burkholderiaceae bacterium]
MRLGVHVGQPEAQHLLAPVAEDPARLVVDEQEPRAAVGEPGGLPDLAQHQFERGDRRRHRSGIAALELVLGQIRQ